MLIWQRIMQLKRNIRRAAGLARWPAAPPRARWRTGRRAGNAGPHNASRFMFKLASFTLISLVCLVNAVGQTASNVTLVASDAMYRYAKGLAEASTPVDAWRQRGFDDSAWSSGQAPFYYDTDGVPVPYTGNTALNDMRNSYLSVFLRVEFSLADANAVSNLFLAGQCDDGYIAWINGTEVWRYNMPAGEPAYNSLAANAPEPLVIYTNALPDPSGYLVDGANVLAIQVFNSSLSSSDLLLDLALSATLSGPGVLPPRVLTVSPAAGDVFDLTNVTVTFSEPVSGVNASDLLVNGSPATGVTGGASNSVYTFRFAQPPYGSVSIGWAAGHGIADFDSPPKSFDATGPGATWQYSLHNPNAPVVTTQNPVADAVINQLTQLTVTFSKSVTGVNASDLLVNGAPATGLSGSGANHTFTFAQPPYGPVSITWAASHGIRDLAANNFDPTLPGNTWAYTLVDQTPPAIAAQNPPAGAPVTNLTRITVTFTEPVSGVDAGDLLINGTPATGLSGSGAIYTFTFPVPNATLINVTWAAGHGIQDLASAPNAFDASAPGATWSYVTPDAVPPIVAGIEPSPNTTVRALSQIVVTFTEPVTGVDAADLVVNSAPAQTVSGAGAGPYVFRFLQPSNGPVDVRWAAGHGIRDLATPPNAFAGGSWTYTLAPDASYVDQVVISEIMYHPAPEMGEDVHQEWIELHNKASTPVNLNGWQLTKGVNYTFTNASIPAGGYLVVAANKAVFHTRYPGVTNVVGDWVGRLSNNGDDIHLRDAQGQLINSVSYGSQGDWSVRLRGRGERQVASLTRSGTTVTAFVFGHDMSSGDTVRIYGAAQPEYNGTFSISVVDSSRFTYTIAGTPVTPATGQMIICRQLTDLGANRRGWAWSSLADGLGRSMELVNENLPNQYGQNWTNSGTFNGTPGAPNSAARTNLAPLILNVAHFPLVPHSTDAVTITARLLDEHTNGLAATLWYRNASSASPPGFSGTTMFDDGLHGDGLAGDGIYGAILPAQANLTVIEFYVEASDLEGNHRTWPAPALDPNDAPLQQANALYQVDDGTYAGNQPIYRLIMTETERAELRSNHDSAPNSDAAMNATFVSVDGAESLLLYNVGVRNRGAGTRTAWPMNYRLGFPNDQCWKGRRGVHLNTQYTFSQMAGYALSISSGIDTEAARAVQVRVNGANLANDNTSVTYGSYIQLEDTDSDYAGSHYPNDGAGNAYRGSTGSHNATIDWRGTDPTAWEGLTGSGFFKSCNVSENDWSDLINLSAVLNTNTPDDAVYAAAVSRVANVEQWMRNIAVFQLAGSGETAFQTGRGDDYAMYRGINDPRFILLAHDWDTVLNQGSGPGAYNRTLFYMCPGLRSGANTYVLNRFMTNAYFVPIYYEQLNDLLNTSFSLEQLSLTLDRALGDWVPANIMTSMRTWATNRYTWVRSQIPLALTVNHSLGSSGGYPYTTSATMALSGVANAIKTRSVLVNGSSAAWTAYLAQWSHSSVSLRPGINRIVVQALDEAGREIDRRTLDVWYDNAAVTTVPGGTLSGATTWLAANSPYRVTGDLTIPSGSTLSIQPGTTVYFDANVGLTIAGRLLAAGTDTQRIRFTRQPGSGNIWHNLQFQNTTTESRLAYVDIESSGSGPTIAATNAALALDHVAFTNITSQYLVLENTSFNIRNSVFPTLYDITMIQGRGLPANGYGIFESNWFGTTTLLSDVIEFTGGKRPNAILQVLNNTFTGSGDDILDLRGADAHIEGNVFMHARQMSPGGDTANAIAAGQNNSISSAVTVARNLFFDCDHAALAKDGSFVTLENNTIMHALDSAVNFAEPLGGGTGGAGARLDGNIIWDAPALFENYNSGAMQVTVDHSILPAAFAGAGNLVIDPMLRNTGTNTVSWQTITSDLALRPGSPAIGAGPNGLDMGALVPAGATIAGEPASPTPAPQATLTVGGPGITHYRYRVNNGAYSVNEYAAATPITLSGLANGSYTVRVIGKNSAGVWQSTNAETVSRAWIVDANAPALRLNELLASNDSAVNHNGTSPDVVELFNVAGITKDLGGVRLTDDPRDPNKFVFPPGTSLAGDAYLVVYADNPNGTPGFHLGFNLNQDGGSLFLYDSETRGGALLDSVDYGMQLTDLSIGRLADGGWALCEPTFGSANVPARLGDFTRLKINEWLAAEAVEATADFVELYNPGPLPVLLSGLYLTDNAIGWPTQHLIAPLTYIPAQGFTVFKADGDANAGPDHLNFRLSADRGVIALLAPDLTLIDQVVYGPQFTDVSQGRSPNGANRLVFFNQPSPGAPNPVVAGAPTTNITSVNIPLVDWTSSWRYEATGRDMGTAWRAPGYNDSAWPVGLGGFDHGNPGLPLISTTIPWTSPQQITFYFRTSFVLTNATNGFSLTASHYIDDGAVVYLNGQEIYRYNIAPGTVSYSTLATFISGPPPLVGPVTLPLANLVPGTNLLAVEVHQGTATSGDMDMILSLALTKWTTNYTGGTPVVLNEILARNDSIQEADGSTPDWVELYNQSAGEIDLGDYSLTDSLADPRRWVVPSGLRIPAFGYFRVRCDGSLPGSVTNTGFGLKATGGSIYLFDKSANGGALLDSVEYGIQVSDLSIGRIPNGTGGWTLTLPSPGSVNLPLTLGSAAVLKVNEWMANPASGADWFEIYNPGSDPVALGGLRLSDDLTTAGLVKYPAIPALSFIGVQTNAYQRFWADDTPSAGADHVKFQLKASGEAVAIATAPGALIDGVSFGAQTPGVSEGRFPDGSATIVTFPETASPGESNYRLLTNVVINEALTHTDLPLEDAIELRNLTGAPVNIGGWWLSDAKGSLRKYRIADNTVLGANGYAVFYESQFNFDPLNNPLAFALSSANGDQVYLSAADGNGTLTGYRATVKFGPAENGVSFGRYVTSVGDEQFVAMSARTFGVDDPGTVAEFRTGAGAPNAYPKVGPVVVSEIMYHPPDLGTNDNVRDEFIELHNLSTAPVPLYDPAFPTNTWRLRDAVDFEFPPSLTLPPGGELLLVSFDPVADAASLAAFRSAYHLDASLPIFGPYRGKLANSSAKVELWKPDPPDPAGTPNAGFVPYVLVERIHYADSAPWPTGADGTGPSLQRLNLAAFGDDPANWIAAAPTPGPQGLPVDSDLDGLPDSWELQYFGTLARNGAGDFDGDGVSDLREYLGGSDPTDPGSVPVFTIAFDGSTATLTLTVAANRSYSVQFKNALTDPTWTKLADISPRPSAGAVQLIDPTAGSTPMRFYRWVTPAQP